MKRNIAAVCVALSLGGCTTLGPDAQTLNLDAGKALLVSESAVDGANQAATLAAQSGACKDGCAVKLKAAVDQANQAMDTAHKLYTTDKAGAVAALKNATDAVVDVKKILAGG